MADGIVQAIGLPFNEAIDHFKEKIRQPASAEHASWTEVWGEAHARAFTVAGAASDALLADFQAELAKALKNGTTLADFRKSFDEIVARHGWQQRHEPGWRAQIIYETNMATAHAAGRYAQLTDPDVLEAYPYWQYVHSGSRHPRIQHVNWNGKVFAADDPWWDIHYPPNGWRCGCRVRPVSGPALRRAGRSGPDVAPANTYRPWTDKRTGQVHMVPNGIDPGWDYNVGKAWKQGAPPPVAPPKPPPVPPPGPGPKTVGPKTVAAAAPDLAEANKMLTRHYAGWARGGSKAELAALDAYKEGGAAMQAALRHGADMPAAREDAKMLAGFIGRAEAPEDMVVFRGLRGELARAVAGLAAGAQFTDAGFSSASLSGAVARRFMRKRKSAILLEIVVPKGYRGAAYVHPTPQIRKQQFEMLLAPGATFRVIGQEGDVVTVEVLPEAASHG